jgi:hypothetical protein
VCRLVHQKNCEDENVPRPTVNRYRAFCILKNIRHDHPILETSLHLNMAESGIVELDPAFIGEVREQTRTIVATRCQICRDLGCICSGPTVFRVTVCYQVYGFAI